MANEVSDWKQGGCSLEIMTSRISVREIFSTEINETFGEGGGLNANYRDVESVAKVSNILGSGGLMYGRQFIFKTAGIDKFTLDFSDKTAKAQAEQILKKYELI